MSKYNVGDKFIVQIAGACSENEFTLPSLIPGKTLYRVKGIDNIIVDDEILDRLELLQEEKIRVGDVVYGEDELGIVTRAEDGAVYILWSDGSAGKCYEGDDIIKKAGRQIDILNILSQIGGKS